jgi:hypothetical protein
MFHDAPLQTTRGRCALKKPGKFFYNGKAADTSASRSRKCMPTREYIPVAHAMRFSA